MSWAEVKKINSDMDMTLDERMMLMKTKRDIYLASNTFVVPQTGYFLVTVIGKGGTPANADYRLAYAGGGAGGVAQSLLYLEKNASISITVNEAVSSFGAYLSATSGESPTSTTGGTGGTATGGNVFNIAGGTGGDGSGGRNDSGGDGGSVGITCCPSSGGGGGFAHPSPKRGGNGGEGYSPFPIANATDGQSGHTYVGGRAGSSGGGGGAGAGSGIAQVASGGSGGGGAFGGGRGGKGGSVVTAGAHYYGGGGGGGGGAFGGGGGGCAPPDAANASYRAESGQGGAGAVIIEYTLVSQAD